MIRRHSATAIFMHWYNAACWLLLLFTGFALLANPLMQPVGDWWSSLWTGAFGALGLLRLHVVVGMAWIVLYAAYLLVRARAEALPFLKEITDLHIGSDLVWCLRKGLWLVLGERAHAPPRARSRTASARLLQRRAEARGDHRRSVQPWARPDRADPRVRLRQAGDGGAPADLPARAFLLRRADGCFPARAHLHGGLRTRRGPGAAVHVHRIRAAGAHQAPQPGCGSASWRNRKRNRARFF